MAVRAEQVINLVEASSQPSLEISLIVLKYASLRQKLNRPEAQSWYFLKGLNSKRGELITLKKQFNDYRADFNSFTLDQLVIEKHTLAEDFVRAKKINGVLIRSFAISALSQRKEHIGELLRLKSRMDHIHEVEFYLSNHDEMNKLLL